MAQPFSSLVLIFISVFFEISLCHTEQPLLYLPPLEVRSMKMNKPGSVSDPVMQFHQVNEEPNAKPQHIQSVLHTTPPATSPNVVTSNQPDHHQEGNITLQDFIEALHELAQHKEDHSDINRAAITGNEYEYSSQYPYGLSHPTPYDYPQRPLYGPWAPPLYQNYPSTYGPPTTTIHHADPSKSLLKPDVKSISKPATSKLSTKLGGLIGIVITLLSGLPPENLHLKKIKDFFIDSILAPIFGFKGTMKPMIGKLLIPLGSLLLINLEFLITIWWLWEDCPQPPATSPAPPAYSYPKPNYYNSYR